MKWEQKPEQDPLMAQGSNLHDLQDSKDGEESSVSSANDGYQQPASLGQSQGDKSPLTDRQLKGAMVAGGAACLLGGVVGVAAVGAAALAIAHPENKNSKKVIEVAKAAGDTFANAGDRIVHESKQLAKNTGDTVTRAGDSIAHETRQVVKSVGETAARAGNHITKSSKQAVEKIDRVARKIPGVHSSPTPEERVAEMG